ncbi:transporter substrate-binding domain-containing protein [Porphyromonas catoniae]|uniref:ABC transporter, substrate-binding protein, family 3 n=1 Tax=Porphyromonas catoniae ATCC 51270 TaxID=887901 RepID=Z4WXG5_9PORP|nr:transporter substrate-binding domain-containing protein [Porphyromonas catoniae]EWC93517.1 ABC transporter, substrate-binding protein, family 3 [Porphyromonas catoniae ATCC 51270]
MRSRLFTLRSLTYLAGLVAIIALMLYLHHQARKRADSTDSTPIIRDYPEIRREGTLRLCTSYNEGGIKAQGGELSGLVYDLAKVLQQRSGLRVEVVLENNWEKALTYLSSGQVDLVTRPTASTSDIDTTRFRLFGQEHSGPIFLIQRRADSTTFVTSQIQLSGRTITLPLASPYRLFLEHLSEEIGEAIHLEEDSLYQAEQLAMQVASGKIDYTICTDKEAQRFKTLFPELDCTLPLSYSFRTAWLLRRAAPALSDSLSLWLKK